MSTPDPAEVPQPYDGGALLKGPFQPLLFVLLPLMLLLIVYMLVMG